MSGDRWVAMALAMAAIGLSSCLSPAELQSPPGAGNDAAMLKNCFDPEDPLRAVQFVEPDHCLLQCDQDRFLQWNVTGACGDYWVDVEVLYDGGTTDYESLVSSARNLTGVPWRVPDVVCDDVCVRVRAWDRLGPLRGSEVHLGPVLRRTGSEPVRPPEYLAQP